jgi:hypothetical protein
MDKKPDLIVKLFAGDTLVDQSTDTGLWQRVLSEIKGLTPIHPIAASNADTAVGGVGDDVSAMLRSFAKKIGVTPDEAVGSLDPTSDAPYIRLNSHDWEALKRNTPVKGPGSIAPSVLAATALVLWQKDARFGDVALQTVRATISTIDLDDQNAARSIGNCDWLQYRSGRITLNPSHASTATRLLRAYCRREALAEAG